MLIGKAELARRIPHAGAMCLLEGVVRWDETSIGCVATSHREAGNPLARNGILPVLAGIEYAAQAMALHGGLCGAVEDRPRRGYLASLRDVRCHASRLDDVGEDLMIEAERLMGDGARVIYAFRLGAGGTILVEGRAAVVLDA